MQGALLSQRSYFWTLTNAKVDEPREFDGGKGSSALEAHCELCYGICMTNSRIFLWALIVFIAGVAVRSFVDVGYVHIVILVMASATLWAVSAIRRTKLPFVFGLCALALALGIFRFDAALAGRPNLSGWYGRKISAVGIVREDSEHTENAQRLSIRATTVNDEPVSQEFFVLVTTGKYPEYRIGDELVLTGMLERPENFNDDFDYASYLAKDRIFATMYFPDIAAIGSQKGSKIKLALSSVKAAFEERLERVLPEPHAAFLKGLLLGGRGALPKELVEDFQKTGTSHIVALSGYNITLVSRFFMLFLLFLTVSFYAAFWIAVSAIVLFVILVGGGASVVRAGILGALVLIAEREGRLYSVRNALALAAAIMIWANPMVLRFDVAFQLSFLATLGLVYASTPVERAVDRVSTRVRSVFGNRTAAVFRKAPYRDSFAAGRLISGKRMLVETLAAQLAVLPLLIVHFGSISLVSPVANVLVLAAVPASMAAGFVTGVVGFLSETAAYVPAAVSWAFLEYKLRVIGFFASIPFAQIRIGAWGAAIIIGAYAVVAMRALRSKRLAIAFVPNEQDRPEREEEGE